MTSRNNSIKEDARRKTQRVWMKQRRISYLGFTLKCQLKLIPVLHPDKIKFHLTTEQKLAYIKKHTPHLNLQILFIILI